LSMAYFVHCFAMEDAAGLYHSESDEVILVDDETTGDPGSKESAVMQKKQHNSLPVLKQTDRQGKISYPFLENPDDRDVTLFTILTVTKLFGTAKGKGVVEAWQAAVDEMNAQVNKTTNCKLFDPPIAVRTVRWWFDNAMKLIKEICAAVPFHSGCDDEEEPNSLQLLLEDLYDLKTSFEDGIQGQKVSTVAQKKKDCEAAKAIQEAAISRFSSSPLDSSEEPNPKRGKTDSGEKRSCGSLRQAFDSMCESIADRKSLVVEELALKKELLRKQMSLKKAQVEAQLKMKAEQHELVLQQEKQQLEQHELVLQQEK
jgi:hypothetical protein